MVGICHIGCSHVRRCRVHILTSVAGAFDRLSAYSFLSIELYFEGPPDTVNVRRLPAKKNLIASLFLLYPKNIAVLLNVQNRHSPIVIYNLIENKSQSPCWHLSIIMSYVVSAISSWPRSENEGWKAGSVHYWCITFFKPGWQYVWWARDFL